MKRIAVAIVVLLAASHVYAKTGLTDAPSIRHQHMLRKARHEITPAIGATLGDAYARNLMLQLGYTYHITDWIGVGAEFSYGVAFKTALTEGIESEVTGDPEWQKVHTGEKYQLARTGLNVLALAKVTLVPFSGKLVLFRKFLGYADVHINVGGGMAMVKGHGGLSDETSFAILVGGGFRFFPMKWWSVNFDVNDYMVPRIVSRAATGSGGDKTFSQNPAFMFGVSFFLPTGSSVGI
ncbi:MAG: outer membrane beta-barrel domain-containing protein [Deltaproteobacteria bacterium]|nr:outer membrane beta-barrel domain-containing protein [Deltaproteobacteria bacterium]